MAIRKRQRAKGVVFQVYWNNPITGKRESESFDDEHDAKVYDAEINRRLVKDRASFTPEPEEDRSAFRSLASAYIRAKTEMADSTRSATLYSLKSIILPVLGDKEAASLVKADLKAVESACRDRGSKQNTVNRNISIVKAILNWAEDEGLIPANPVPRYICKRGTDAKIPPPSPEEARKLAASSPPHLQRAIILAFSLGVRVGRSELLALKWADVDFQARRIRVWSAKKNREMPWRDIDLKDDLLFLLASWRAQDEAAGLPWIIHYRGQPVASIKRGWALAKKRAGITREMRPYDLRHAFATQALAGGADLKAVAQIMGHQDTQMVLRTYQHVLGQLRKDAVERIPSVAPDVESGHTPGHMAGHIQAHQSGGFHVPDDEQIQ